MRMRILVPWVGALCVVSAIVPQVSARAAQIQAVHTHGSFNTAGVIVALAADNGNEAATLEIRGPEDTSFRPAHPFTRYDAHGLATSLFGLAAGTTYSLRITLNDPDGVSGPNPYLLQIRTREEFSLPVPQRVVSVSNTADLRSALSGALPGDEIRLQPGVYGPIDVSKRAPASAPIVLRASDPANRPIIDGVGASGVAVNVTGSEHVVFDGLEVRNAGNDGSGIGVRIHSSSHVAVQNSFIHDNGRTNILITGADLFPGGATAGGFHLIQGNVIADTRFTSCTGASNGACPGQTYFGIQQDGNPGAGTVIRNNTIYGHVDNAHVCGDEGSGRSLAEDANVLAITGGSWTNHDLDFYNNFLYNARDDHIELDGICVNARVFRNTFGDAGNPEKDAQNPISISPALPGPYFVLRNLVTGNWGEAGVKMNTAAGGSNPPPIRNLYFYHNTFARLNEGTLINLWYSVPGDHNVPIKNIVFRNNAFWAMAGGRATDANNRGSEHPHFDYDVWYTTTSASDLFEWWDGVQLAFGRFSAFQQYFAGRLIAQEANGLFEPPGLGSDLRPVGSGSVVVDRGLRIAGINDDFNGAAPDIGAQELILTATAPPSSTPFSPRGASGCALRTAKTGFDPALLALSMLASAGIWGRRHRNKRSR